MKSLKIFKDFVVQGQGLVNWSSRTRTFLDDYNTGDNEFILIKSNICIRSRKLTEDVLV